MQIEKLVASKIIPQLLKLPRRLSEMTEKQRQLVELTCVRARIDPELKRHVSKKKATDHLPTVLKLTTAATLGYWKNLGVKLVDPSMWDALDNLYFIEDIPVYTPDIDIYIPKAIDPFRICMEAYFKDEYIPLRAYKNKTAISYMFGVSKQNDDFLGFEAPFTNNLYEGELNYSNQITRTVAVPNTTDLPFTYNDLKNLTPQNISSLPEDIRNFVLVVGEPRIVNSANALDKNGDAYVIYIPKKNLQKYFYNAPQLVVKKNHFYDDNNYFQSTVPARRFEDETIDRDEAALIFAETMVELYNALPELTFEQVSIHAVVCYNKDKVERTLKVLESEGILKSPVGIGVMMAAFKNILPGKKIRGTVKYTNTFSYPVEYCYNIKKGKYLMAQISKEVL